MTDPATERWEGRGRRHKRRRKARTCGTPGDPLRYRGDPPCGRNGNPFEDFSLWWVFAFPLLAFVPFLIPYAVFELVGRSVDGLIWLCRAMWRSACLLGKAVICGLAAAWEQVTGGAEAEPTRAAKDGGSPSPRPPTGRPLPLPPGMVFISEAELRKYKRLAAWGVGAALGILIGLVIGAVQVGAALVDRFGR